jgi:predicted acetyltransferase
LALRLMLHRAREEGLEYIEITMDPDNIASRKIVEANGGVLFERFQYPVEYGGKDGLRFRIDL